MRYFAILLLLIAPVAASGQHFDFSAAGGVCFTSKQTSSTPDEKTGNGTSVVVTVLKTGRILYFGCSVGLHKLTTTYETKTAPSGVAIIYASPAIECNLQFGTRFNFSDNAIDAGITAGVAFNQSNGTSAIDKQYTGNYKPYLLGINIGYVRYFKMVGVGVSVNPHLSNSVHNNHLNLIVIPATIGVHVRI